MDEITKELLEALKTIESWNSHTTAYAVDFGSNGVRDFYRAIARQSIAKAEATLAATQPSADAVEAAFREGFRSPTTYNDTVMNSEDDAWENSEARAKAALAAPQSDDGWIPWEGGACPVAHSTIVDVRLRNQCEGRDVASNWRWYHEKRGNSILEGADIIAYRVVKP